MVGLPLVAGCVRAVSSLSSWVRNGPCRGLDSTTLPQLGRMWQHQAVKACAGSRFRYNAIPGL